LVAKREIKNGTIFQSNNYGSFEILKEIPVNKRKRRFLVKFLETGTEKDASISEISNGEIKDNYYPKIFGVGCIGNGHKKGNESLYNRWLCMLTRCYDKSNINYISYGEKGVEVDSRWHCFEYYLEDVVNIKGFDYDLLEQGLIELDKDYLQINESGKLYSKDTCIWISPQLNCDVKFIEMRKRTKTSSKYIGVCYVKPSGKWQAEISVNQKLRYIGTFSLELAAGNAYNYYSKKYQEDGRIINDCPYMPKEEWIKYMSNPKRLKENLIVEDILLV
jgi:hypothetical protein